MTPDAFNKSAYALLSEGVELLRAHAGEGDVINRYVATVEKLRAQYRAAKDAQAPAPDVAPPGFRIVGMSGPKSLPLAGQWVQYIPTTHGPRDAPGQVSDEQAMRPSLVFREWWNEGRYALLEPIPAPAPEPSAPPAGHHVILEVDATTPILPERCYMPTENPDGSMTTKFPAGQAFTPPTVAPQNDGRTFDEFSRLTDAEAAVYGPGTVAVPTPLAGVPVCKAPDWCGDEEERAPIGTEGVWSDGGLDSPDYCSRECGDAADERKKPLGPPPASDPVTVATGGVPTGFRLGAGWLGSTKTGYRKYDGWMSVAPGCPLARLIEMGALVPVDTARSVPPGPVPVEARPSETLADLLRWQPTAAEVQAAQPAAPASEPGRCPACRCELGVQCVPGADGASYCSNRCREKWDCKLPPASEPAVRPKSPLSERVDSIVGVICAATQNIAGPARLNLRREIVALEAELARGGELMAAEHAHAIKAQAECEAARAAKAEFYAIAAAARAEVDRVHRRAQEERAEAVAALVAKDAEVADMKRDRDGWASIAGSRAAEVEQLRAKLEAETTRANAAWSQDERDADRAEIEGLRAKLADAEAAIASSREQIEAIAVDRRAILDADEKRHQEARREATARVRSMREAVSNAALDELCRCLNENAVPQPSELGWRIIRAIRALPLDAGTATVTDTACYCSDFNSAGLPCLPGQCPNRPKPQATGTSGGCSHCGETDRPCCDAGAQADAIKAAVAGERERCLAWLQGYWTDARVSADRVKAGIRSGDDFGAWLRSGAAEPGAVKP